MPDVITCEGVTKRFGRLEAVKDLDLSVPQGQVLGYLGPNGAGKSTTIRMLVGLTTPSEGKINVLGADPFRQSDWRRDLGYSPGELRLDDRLTVKETLASWEVIRGGVDTRYRDELIERFQLGMDKKASSLSTGNRRKLGLVGAFMARPKLLILDEPTNGLDPMMQETFLQVAAEAVADGATILLSSHIMSEVEQIADEIMIIREGETVAKGTLEEMRHGVPHVYRVVFSGDVPPVAEVEALDGAEKVSLEDQTLTVHWSDAPTPLIGLLARYDIENLTASQPNLEHAFFRRYSAAGNDASGHNDEAGA